MCWSVRRFRLLREIYRTTVIVLERVDRNQGLFAQILIEILKDLNRAQSATLRLQFSGGGMPKTVAVGGTSQALFQEWTGPAVPGR